MKQILSQEELDRFIEENSDKLLDCFIEINYGLYSAISIYFDGDNYYNEIDSTTDIVKHDKLMDSFPIGDAIKKGTLYIF